MTYDYSPATSSDSSLRRYVGRVTKVGPSVPDHGLWFAFPPKGRWPPNQNCLNRRWTVEGIELTIHHGMKTYSIQALQASSGAGRQVAPSSPSPGGNRAQLRKDRRRGATPTATSSRIFRSRVTRTLTGWTGARAALRKTHPTRTRWGACLLTITPF